MYSFFQKISYSIWFQHQETPKMSNVTTCDVFWRHMASISPIFAKPRKMMIQPFVMFVTKCGVLWSNRKKVMAVEIRVLKTALWPQICPFWAISGRSIRLTQVESTDSIWFTGIIKDILRGMFQMLASYSLLGLLWEGFYAYKTPKTPNLPILAFSERYTW